MCKVAIKVLHSGFGGNGKIVKTKMAALQSYLSIGGNHNAHARIQKVLSEGVQL